MSLVSWIPAWRFLTCSAGCQVGGLVRIRAFHTGAQGFQTQNVVPAWLSIVVSGMVCFKVDSYAAILVTIVQ